MKLTLQAIGKVAARIPVFGPVAESVMVLVVEYFDERDLWREAEVERRILEAEARVDAEAAAAFPGVGRAKTEPPPPPDTIPGAPPSRG